MWVFDNVLLPDSNVNEPGSHGFVKYKIMQKPGNSAGTQILNTAGILFDYNDAVMTNATISTVVDSTAGIHELKNPVTVIYPNPAGNFIVLGSPVQLQNSEWLVYDLYGKQLSVKKVSSNVLDISALSPGIYIVKIPGSDKIIHVQKFVKQ